MKVLLTTILTGFLTAPLALACDTCDEHNKDKEKEKTEEILLADCDECDGDEKEEDTLLAHCGECGDDEKHEEEEDDDDAEEALVA